VLGILEGIAAGLGTLALLLSIGGLALTAAHTAAVRRDRVGPLSRQLSAAVAIAIGQMLLAVVAVGELMFVSRHDALVVSLIAVFTGVVAIVATRLLTAPMLRDVEAIRDGLVAVGDGRRDVRVTTTGRDELTELADAANAMIMRLEAEEGARDAAEAARRSLIAAVSHDLRTPITSLQLLAEAVADDLVDDSTRHAYIERMGTHIRALSALIDDLFELSRLESGEISWSLERVSLPELVGETVAALRVQAEAKGVAVRLEVPDALAPARANPEKVQRVLFNLIQNAIRHTPADGSVTVRAEPGQDGVEIEVADTGDGISAGDRDRVFDAFFRGGSEAARTSSGAGLGLAISRAIVEAHGGRIWLEDSDRGTRVRFALPAAA
jgi:signal transduction histidine kinase